jgi:hypothetical protein
MAAEEGSNFVTIAAGRHGAPAAAVRTGVIVEKEAAGGIRAATNGRAKPFDEKIGGRTGDSGEEPLEAALACNELEGPCTFTKDELIMSFRDAQDFVHRLGPGRRKRLFVDDRSENGSERLTKAKGAKQDGVDGAGFRGKKRARASTRKVTNWSQEKWSVEAMLAKSSARRPATRGDLEADWVTMNAA